jgi:hypothetical protein
VTCPSVVKSPPSWGGSVAPDVITVVPTGQVPFDQSPRFEFADSVGDVSGIE